MKPIYLDYAATTPIDPRVAKKMAGFLTQEGIFGNPSSLHAYGLEARDAIEEARVQVAKCIKADTHELIFTSGATEANNLALKGIAQLYQQKGKHIVTVKTEHKAVLDPCQHLEKEGWKVTYLTPEKTGLIDLEKLKEALRSDTILVSVMHVNNETGVMQPIEEIAEITSARNIFLHVDAAQSIGKMAIDMDMVPIDLLSLSAHKVYGPKGIGALYLRKKPRVRVAPLIHGGGHEQGMRSGTLATHQIVGMGEAFYLAQQEMQQDYKNIFTLRNLFLENLKPIKNFILNVHLKDVVPHILNVRFDGMLAEAILQQLPRLAISTASACQGKGAEGSYVLRAMGFNEEEVKSSLRFSFGRFTTEDEIRRAAAQIKNLFK